MGARAQLPPLTFVLTMDAPPQAQPERLTRAQAGPEEIWIRQIVRHATVSIRAAAYPSPCKYTRNQAAAAVRTSRSAESGASPAQVSARLTDASRNASASAGRKRSGSPQRAR